MNRASRALGRLVLGVLLANGWCALAADDVGAGKEGAARSPTFEKDIEPILRATCWRCHGEKSLKGELDLRTLAGIRKGGESGPAIVAGKPDESVLFEKVRDGEMPPGKKDRLADADVA